MRMARLSIYYTLRLSHNHYGHLEPLVCFLFREFNCIDYLNNVDLNILELKSVIISVIMV